MLCKKFRFERFKKFLFRLKREENDSQQNFMPEDADVAELAYAYGLGPYGETLGGSTPSVRKDEEFDAGVTQLVECHVANVIVAGSNPVSRSMKNLRQVNFSWMSARA